MNVAPLPTFISSVISLFRKCPQQPTFTPATSTIPTQVYITCDTTTHVDSEPIRFTNPFARHHFAFDEKLQGDSPYVSCTSVLPEKQQHCFYPETPRAPNAHRTTFALPLHDWSTAAFLGGERYLDDQASLSEVDLDIPPGHTLVCHPTEPGVYAVAEPKTLARALFFFGFLFPAFWIAGLAIMIMPLRTTTDWEAGKNSLEIEWACSVIRNIELRWSRRCLVALLSEMTVIILVIVIVKWGITAPI